MTDLLVLQLDRVSGQFPQMPQPAVDAVSLALYQGEILGLLGPSGCGKTTLLRLIAGFEPLQGGTIQLKGQIVAGKGEGLPPEKRDLGMVFQDYALFPHLNVFENVAFGLKNRTRSRRHARAQVQRLTQAAIALVGLEGLDKRYPHELSGGQQQRVALARALAPQPSLVLLDEPLSNLDVQVRLRLRHELRDILKRAGTSAIFVTHDQEEALSMSDRVAVMRQGRLEQLDFPEVIYREPASRFVAEFVTQANFLPAQHDGQGWKTEIGYFSHQQIQGEIWDQDKRRATSSDCRCDQTEMSGDFKVDLCTGDLMIRQEDLQLEPAESGGVVIRDCTFLGREFCYTLLTPSGRELFARTTHRRGLQVGMHVKLSVKGQAHIFPIHRSPVALTA
uniref:ABC-type quaternary amine transporter n=1 Tax=Cyanothece sp. (strain PCC 7425 / ATCC 29141) TaxID=395961 RepID=B8HR11_CYAP4